MLGIVDYFHTRLTLTLFLLFFIPKQYPVWLYLCFVINNLHSIENIYSVRYQQPNLSSTASCPCGESVDSMASMCWAVLMSKVHGIASLYRMFIFSHQKYFYSVLVFSVMKQKMFPHTQNIPLGAFTSSLTTFVSPFVIGTSSWLVIPYAAHIL